MKTSVIQTTENRIIVDFIIKQIEERSHFYKNLNAAISLIIRAIENTSILSRRLKRSQVLKIYKQS